MIDCIKYFSGWASGSIGMEFAKEHGFECVLLNEYDRDRLSWSCNKHSNAEPILGDFTDPLVYSTLVRLFKEKNIDLAIFSPNCQPFCLAGGRHLDSPEAFYFLKILDFIEDTKPKWAWIENAKEFPTSILVDSPKTIEARIRERLVPLGYDVNMQIQDAAKIKYGSTPQHRRRCLFLISRVGGKWEFPEVEEDNTKWLTSHAVIDYLPRIQAGERSVIPYHFRPYMPPHQIVAIHDLLPGQNAPYFPNVNGTVPLKPRPNHAARRIPEFEPCPTIVQKSASPTGYSTLHYRDDGCLSTAELILLTGLDLNWHIPLWARGKDQFIRDLLGECFAPRHVEQILLELLKIIPR